MSNEVATKQPRSVLIDMSSRFGMEPAAFEQTLRATVMPSDRDVSREQFAAFLLVAKEYNLNPLTKEIYAFPGKGGSIQPIVSIDGWMRMINNHSQFDGMEFNDNISDDGKLISITCNMYRKDRTHPVSVTEYMIECRRETDTWKKWPARMLRHKSAIQASRYAFGFSGIYDEDEAARLVDTQRSIDVTPASSPASVPGRPSRVAAIVGAAKATETTTIDQQQEVPPVDTSFADFVADIEAAEKKAAG